MLAVAVEPGASAEKRGNFPRISGMYAKEKTWRMLKKPERAHQQSSTLKPVLLLLSRGKASAYLRLPISNLAK